MRALTVLLLSVLMLLPAPVFADARAERVLVFFNTPWLVRWGIDQGAAQMAQTSPEEAAFFSKVLRDHYDEEEVLTLLGNELASRVAAGDLEALVQFAGTSSGRQVEMAMRGKAPTEMQAALNALPASVQADLNALAATGAINRVSAAMNHPEFQRVGERYGAEIACRAVAIDYPERHREMTAAGQCGGSAAAPPAPPAPRAEGAKQPVKGR